MGVDTRQYQNVGIAPYCTKFQIVKNQLKCWINVL